MGVPQGASLVLGLKPHVNYLQYGLPYLGDLFSVFVFNLSMYKRNYQRKPNPLLLNYVKILRICLWTIAAWPGEVFGEKIHFLVRCFRKYIVIQVAILTYAIIYYLYKYHTVVNFFVLGHCYITMFLGFVTLIRLILTNLKTYKMLMKEFLMSFHLMNYNNYEKYYNKMYNFVNKVSYYYTLCVVAVMLVGVFFFNLFPWYHNYKIGVFSGNRIENSTIDFAIYFTFPGIDNTHWVLPITICNIIITFVASTLYVGNELLLSVMLFQVIGHIEILRNNLQNIPKPKKQILLEGRNIKKGQEFAVFEIYDAGENKYIHTKLIECVDHHRIIVSFTEKLSDCFGFMLAANYLFHLVSCCLLLLECSQGDFEALSRFGPLTVVIFGQLILISCVFEKVGTVSEKIKDNVYDIPWECMDIRNQRTVCIMLNRVQTPITVTAMGMVSVGVTSMAAILKTTFSYFAFLKSINE